VSRTQYYIPCWVFTHRQLPRVPDSRIAFTSADIATVHREMVDTAVERNIWIVGGGDLAGQFADVGLLDEVIVLIAPVTLGGVRLFCLAGSSCVWTTSDGTATSPEPGSPLCAHPHDVGGRFLLARAGVLLVIKLELFVLLRQT
jgi:dihydrofolate reductase